MTTTDSLTEQADAVYTEIGNLRAARLRVMTGRKASVRIGSQSVTFVTANQINAAIEERVQQMNALRWLAQLSETDEGEDVVTTAQVIAALEQQNRLLPVTANPGDVAVRQANGSWTASPRLTASEQTGIANAFTVAEIAGRIITLQRHNRMNPVELTLPEGGGDNGGGGNIPVTPSSHRGYGWVQPSSSVPVAIPEGAAQGMRISTGEYRVDIRGITANGFVVFAQPMAELDIFAISRNGFDVTGAYMKQSTTWESDDTTWEWWISDNELVAAAINGSYDLRN